MSEILKTRAYRDRESGTLTVGQYLKATASQIILPIAATVGGFVLARQWKGSWFARPYGLFGLRKAGDKLLEASEKTGQMVLLNGEGWGLKIGTFWMAFNLWQEQTKKQYDINAVDKSVLRLKQYESANSYLAHENEQLRQQIAFEGRNTPTTTVLAEGRIRGEPLKEATLSAESKR